MSSLHNFVFFIVGLMLLIWLGKSITRLRAIHSLWKAVKQRRVLRVEGLRSQNQLSRDMFQQAILAQCVQTSQQVDNLNVRSHLIKESARMLVGADGRPCISFKLEATAHTKIDVFVGVQHSAMQKILGGATEKGKKKKDEQDLLPLKEGDYLYKSPSHSWTWGSSESLCISFDASWLEFLNTQPATRHPVVVQLTSIHNPHDYTACPTWEAPVPPATAAKADTQESKEEAVIVDNPSTLPLDFRLDEVTVAFLGPEAKAAESTLASQTARVQFDAQLVCTDKHVVEISHLYGLEEDGFECTICFSAIKDVVLLPCRHISVCNTCRPNLQQRCPVCRGDIQSYMKFGEDKVKTA